MLSLAREDESICSETIELKIIFNFNNGFEDNVIERFVYASVAI